MFPLQQSEELWLQISSKAHQEHKIPQDLIKGHHNSSSLDNNYSDIIVKDKGKSKRRRLRAMDSEETTSDNNKKKKLHRDIERQRRQEMATLYATLRTLLPLEYIKGKRSISDHMTEAVNYINHQKKKIKELSAKRDTLKKLSNSRPLTPETNQSSINTSDLSCVKIHQSCDGLEILISSGFGDKAFPLSRVLQVLLQEGREVVSCVSTKANERLLHTIQTQVINDESCSDLSQLQQKLIQAIPSAS